MAKTIKQDPILNTDTEADITDSSFTKSRRRTSLEEFALVKNLRPEVKAGFKAWLKEQYFHFDEEWETLFENYTNRQL